MNHDAWTDHNALGDTGTYDAHVLLCQSGDAHEKSKYGAGALSDLRPAFITEFPTAPNGTRY